MLQSQGIAWDCYSCGLDTMADFEGDLDSLDQIQWLWEQTVLSIKKLSTPVDFLDIFSGGHFFQIYTNYSPAACTDLDHRGGTITKIIKLTSATGYLAITKHICGITCAVSSCLPYRNARLMQRYELCSSKTFIYVLNFSVIGLIGWKIRYWSHLHMCLVDNALFIMWQSLLELECPTLCQTMRNELICSCTFATG